MQDYDKRKEQVRILKLSLRHLLIWSSRVMLTFFSKMCHSKLRGREKRLSSNKKTKRAGSKSQKEQRVPRPAPTVRQSIRGLYRKRWRRRRGRSSWTSTPGSTETHRKNVSKFLFLICTLKLSLMCHEVCKKMFFPVFPDIAELRKKFEEDKQRIALLRAQRKFRPYWTNHFPVLSSLHYCMLATL